MEGRSFWTQYLKDSWFTTQSCLCVETLVIEIALAVKDGLANVAQTIDSTLSY